VAWTSSQADRLQVAKALSELRRRGLPSSGSEKMPSTRKRCDAAMTRFYSAAPTVENLSTSYWEFRAERSEEAHVEPATTFDEGSDRIAARMKCLALLNVWRCL
jgi:hypothetical protein